MLGKHKKRVAARHILCDSEYKKKENKRRIVREVVQGTAHLPAPDKVV